ncbi:MAG TPA: RodZ domain-containing protein [Acetobacteraceae bacterium]|nr:RodZ domain-containing protein [Acetobacteraceae bacterium]
MSSDLTEVDNPPAAPRAGADLRAARERLDWPIEDVAAALRIRQPYLEALEEGRIDLLPGNAYAVGFLRTYAKALGLDPNEIVRRFKAEASEVNRRTELVFPAPMPQRGLPAGAVILLGVVLAVGAYAGWYRLSGDGKLPAETVAPVPQRLASLADQVVPPLPSRATGISVATPSRQSAAVAAAGTQRASATRPGVTPAPVFAGRTDAAAPEPLAVGSAGSASARAVPGSAAPASGMTVATSTDMTDGSARQPPPPVPAISPTSAAAASVPPVAMPAPVAPNPAAVPASSAPDQATILLKATADAWVQVRDRNGGSVLLNRILHSGDTWTVPSHANLVLTTGNAGGTELVVDGVTVQVPGGAGAVRRDLPLDPELIKNGRFAQLTSLTVPGGAAMGRSAASPGGSHPADQ